MGNHQRPGDLECWSHELTRFDIYVIADAPLKRELAGQGLVTGGGDGC